MSEALVRVSIRELPEGVFLATSDELPGLIAQGRTLAETLDLARDVARALMESYAAHGDPLPPNLRALGQGDNQFVLPVAVG